MLRTAGTLACIYLHMRRSVTDILYTYSYIVNLVHNHKPQTKALSNKKGNLLLNFLGIKFSFRARRQEMY